MSLSRLGPDRCHAATQVRSRALSSKSLLVFKARQTRRRTAAPRSARLHLLRSAGEFRNNAFGSSEADFIHESLRVCARKTIPSRNALYCTRNRPAAAGSCTNRGCLSCECSLAFLVCSSPPSASCCCNLSPRLGAHHSLALMLRMASSRRGPSCALERPNRRIQSVTFLFQLRKHGS